jgi:hypothetical protein
MRLPCFMGGGLPLFMLMSLAVGGSAYVLIPRGTLAGPRLGMPPYPLDLGRGKSGQIVDGSFELRNLGASPLSFKLAPSCGCSDLSPRTGSIPAGETLDIHVGIRLQDEGAEKDVSIAVESNDPLATNERFLVRAFCAAPLMIAPRSIDFGAVARGSSPRISAQVRDEQDQPLGSRPGLRLSASSPAFRVEEVSEPQGERSVAVTLAADLPPGSVSGVIRVRLPDQERDLEIPVSARVLGAIQTAPSSLVLDRGNPQFFAWRPDGKPLGALKDVSLPPGRKVEELSKPSDRRRRFRLIPGQLTPASSRTIRLTFAEVAEPAELVVHSPTSFATPSPPE